MELHTFQQSLQDLTVAELDNIMAQILAIRKQKLPSVLSQNETILLQKINAGLPTHIQKRYDSLAKKRKQETLTTTEHEELLELTDYTEQHQAERLRHLIELASLRNQTLDDLMTNLQIKPVLYVA